VRDVASGRTLSYAAVLALAEQTARRLVGLGVRPGARVGLIAGNTLGYVPAAFGILEMGGCLVPMAPTLRPAETDAIVAATDVNALVRLDGDSPGVEVLDLSRAAPDGFLELDPAFIRFTSGTTATSKGVILSHADVLARVEAADHVFRLAADDRVLWTLPLAYHFAATIVAYVRAGALVLLVGDALPAGLVDAAIEQRATVLYASPVQFERMARAGRRQQLTEVRLAVSTAAALPEGVAAAFEEAFGVRLGQAYGIIEAGLPCINARTDDAPATSVGRPVPGYQIAIVDERGGELPPGSAGEVGVRGRGLFSGYYRPWAPGGAALSGGWLRTGDIGMLDDAGRLTLRGRIKSTIVVAGMKVYAEEVEAVLEGLPGVRESRVVGRAHARLGEVPCAEIVPDPGQPAPEPASLARACAVVLSSYKVPVEFRIVDAIPKTPGGKKLRHASKVSSPPAGEGQIGG
jgi:acyl-CoA synthetase (AMP-forming)/AMP-acid ligase II